LQHAWYNFCSGQDAANRTLQSRFFTTYKRTLVLVDTQWHQFLFWLLADRSPDQAQLNAGLAHLLGIIGTIQVFEVPQKSKEILWKKISQE
jgi:hypothetical protein